MATPRGLTPTRLRTALALLFLALAVPMAVLVWQAQRQIRWEAFHQYRTLAEELAARIDAELQRGIAIEEARGYADYQFLVLTGDPAYANAVVRSPLAQFPVAATIPGLIGYFQVDGNGKFSTPLLPVDGNVAALGLSGTELAQRAALRDRLLDVLSRNQLVARPAASSNVASDDEARANAEQEGKKRADLGQTAFDQLNSVSASPAQSKQKVSDLKLDKPAYPAKAAGERQVAAKAERGLRKEQTVLLEELAAAGADADTTKDSRRVRIFESEVAPFDLAQLDGGQFVLFRNAWHDGARTVQGALLDQDALLDAALARPFRDTALAQMSSLGIAWQGGVLRVVPSSGRERYADAGDLKGTLLYQVRLAAPLGDFQLLWTIEELPAGPGARVVAWSSAVLLLVLIAGFVVIERAGMRQIRLAHQQRDFVAAVSHELKTPLTSIRMYGEMLREGWVDDTRKREYYTFILEESERLSRLIANVLQLARLERNDLQLDPRPVAVAALVDLVRSKVATAVERAGFACRYEVDEACAGVEVQVDSDAFIQILINLVDNALKFAAQAQRKEVVLTVRAAPGRVVFGVRDFGPGVPAEQRGRLFQLFQRAGGELTRATPGTGIGLALARQLARAMGGDLRITQAGPGAEFELELMAALP